ncbi:Leucine Rich Repeat family protein [Trichomonas vaginalis G3]|uniref:Leucine Rich Repeat family protein n=1 Tax=Trichomonas vaginalis (strain ATCC PRA-98 / G3) TaxID=412133 RepID=A2EEP4_TRIV3|nr:uncharacterized protein TVAGG3_0981750 [Trichomonas vaginalis G3]EAY08850.1 Leucine Rich Repeat family protein [Trichomonas vaginalis G3]KAI5489345.1 leucine-rich repeat, isoform f-related family [Trichomonas vaginalis G3]|eukprot:XP_001321073.1 hypothetical protein [Trichomonas vaginalis G3]
MDEKTLYLALSQINMDQELLIGSTWIDVEVNAGQKSKVFLVITEFNLYLFNKQEGKEGLDIIGIYSFFDIKSLEFIHANCFTLSFADKNFKFFGDDIGYIPDLISKQIHLILLPIEIPIIKGKKAMTSQGKRTTLSKSSVLIRLRGKLKLANRYPPQQFIDDMQAYLKTDPSEFEFNNFKDIDNYIDNILEAVEIEPKIETLNFTGKQVLNHWNNLSIFIRNNTTIQKIVISEEINRGFIDFCSSLAKNANSKLKKIEFKEVTFNTEHIEALDRAIQKHPFIYLSFDKCNFSESAGKLSNLIINNTENSVNLNSIFMSSINLSKSDIQTAVHRLNYVSLRGCCLELASLFENFKNSNLIMADFSSNRCTVPINTSVSFPASLKHLCVNDIMWSSSSLTSIFLATTDCDEYLSLSVANCQMLEDDWNSFFSSIEFCGESKITSLCWANNPLHYKLFKFISNSRNIEYVSFSGCQIPSDGSIQKFISTCNSLKYLDLHGSANYKLGYEAFSLLQRILKSKLEYIDFSNNNLDSRFIPLITKLLESNTIKFFLFDAANFDQNFISDLMKQYKNKIQRSNLKEIDFDAFLRTSTKLFSIDGCNFDIQLYFSDSDLEIPKDSQYNNAPAAYLQGSDYWDVLKIDQLQKRYSNSEKQVISWEFNLPEMKDFDIQSFTKEMEISFELETLSNKLMDYW